MNDDPDEPDSNKQDFKIAHCRDKIVVRYKGKIYLAKGISPHKISIDGKVINTKRNFFQRIKKWLGTKIQYAVDGKL